MSTLSDFECGTSGYYMDGNGDYITKEEAQAEVDWSNEQDEQEE